jgi:hypothetical protein
LLLGAAGGEAVLVIGPQKGHFIVSCGDLALERAPSGKGAAFADSVAAWLGLEFAGEAALRSTRAEPARLSWAGLGPGRDAFGIEWETYKLFLAFDESYAEVFLRLTPSRSRGQLVEKWSHYRAQLAAAIEHLVGIGRTPCPHRVAAGNWQSAAAWISRFPEVGPSTSSPVATGA